MSLEEQLLRFISSTVTPIAFEKLCHWRPRCVLSSCELSTKLVYPSTSVEEEEEDKAPLSGICAIADAILRWISQEDDETRLFTLETMSDFEVEKEMESVSLECAENIEY